MGDNKSGVDIESFRAIDEDPSLRAHRPVDTPKPKPLPNKPIKIGGGPLIVPPPPPGEKK